MKNNFIKGIAIGLIVGGFGGYIFATINLEVKSESIPSPTYDQRAGLTRDNISILINEERLKAGLSMLPVSEAFNKDADERVIKVITKCEHDYTDQYGEIINCRVTTSRQAVQLWMESPTHKAFILNPNIKTIGIGVKSNHVVVLGK